ncbi:DUF6053 domain-containing protein [Lysobacter enzymogenes]|uniref:DUF6053 domain-containing protein n=1 Tax=Lysobacter enzymogenes TaxID=69 RepID=UPI003D18BA34
MLSFPFAAIGSNSVGTEVPPTTAAASSLAPRSMSTHVSGRACIRAWEKPPRSARPRPPAAPGLGVAVGRALEAVAHADAAARQVQRQE